MNVHCVPRTQYKKLPIICQVKKSEKADYVKRCQQNMAQLRREMKEKYNKFIELRFSDRNQKILAEAIAVLPQTVSDWKEASHGIPGWGLIEIFKRYPDAISMFISNRDTVERLQSFLPNLPDVQLETSEQHGKLVKTAGQLNRAFEHLIQEVTEYDEAIKMTRETMEQTLRKQRREASFENEARLRNIASNEPEATGTPETSEKSPPKNSPGDKSN